MHKFDDSMGEKFLNKMQPKKDLFQKKTSIYSMGVSFLVWKFIRIMKLHSFENKFNKLSPLHFSFINDPSDFYGTKFFNRAKTLKNNDIKVIFI